MVLVYNSLLCLRLVGAVRGVDCALWGWLVVFICFFVAGVL